MQPTNYLRTAVILSALHISTMCTSTPVILGAGGKGKDSEPQTNTPCRGKSVDSESSESLDAVSQEHAPRAATALTSASIVPTTSLSRIVHGEEIKTPAPTPVSKKEPKKQLIVQQSTLRDHEEKKELRKIDPTLIARQVNPFCGSQDVFTNKLLGFLKIDEIVPLRLVDTVTRKNVDSSTKSPSLLGICREGGNYPERLFRNPGDVSARWIAAYRGSEAEDLRRSFTQQLSNWIQKAPSNQLRSRLLEIFNRKQEFDKADFSNSETLAIVASLTPTPDLSREAVWNIKEYFMKQYWEFLKSNPGVYPRDTLPKNLLLYGLPFSNLNVFFDMPGGGELLCLNNYTGNRGLFDSSLLDNIIFVVGGYDFFEGSQRMGYTPNFGGLEFYKEASPAIQQKVSALRSRSGGTMSVRDALEALALSVAGQAVEEKKAVIVIE